MPGKVLHSGDTWKYHIRIDLYGNDEDIDAMTDCVDHVFNKVSKGLARWM